jgi:anthranilate phosphoribosyltransferase
MIADALQKLLSGENLTAGEARQVVDTILTDSVPPLHIAALLTALRMKGETADEILGAARAMRERVTRIHHHQHMLVDNCGTGGDGAGTFNISTTAAFVLAAAGLPVGKHGNRCISSRCGSADVLVSLGAKIDLTPQQVGQCIDEVGIGFMFAPLLHPAMKAVAPVRKQLGFRTIFNLLGPLTNPAFATHQVIGVFDPNYLEPIARVGSALGLRRVYVVHNGSGIDELAPTGRNIVATASGGSVHSFEIEHGALGIPHCSLEDLEGGSAEENAEITRKVLSGVPGAALDTVVLNAAAGLLAGEKVETLQEGVATARETIESGRATAKLREFIEATRRFADAG